MSPSNTYMYLLIFRGRKWLSARLVLGNEPQASHAVSSPEDPIEEEGQPFSRDDGILSFSHIG